MSRDYPLGARVVFADDTATTSDGSTVVAEGVVNGPPVALADTDEPTHVPVFAARDNMRKPTTIWVALDNILEVRS